MSALVIPMTSTILSSQRGSDDDDADKLIAAIQPNFPGRRRVSNSISCDCRSYGGNSYFRPQQATHAVAEVREANPCHDPDNIGRPEEQLGGARLFEKEARGRFAYPRYRRSCEASRRPSQRFLSVDAGAYVVPAKPRFIFLRPICRIGRGANGGVRLIDQPDGQRAFILSGIGYRRGVVQVNMQINRDTADLLRSSIVPDGQDREVRCRYLAIRSGLRLGRLHGLSGGIIFLRDLDRLDLPSIRNHARFDHYLIGVGASVPTSCGDRRFELAHHPEISALFRPCIERRVCRGRAEQLGGSHIRRFVRLANVLERRERQPVADLEWCLFVGRIVQRLHQININTKSQDEGPSLAQLIYRESTPELREADDFRQSGHWISAASHICHQSQEIKPCYRCDLIHQYRDELTYSLALPKRFRC